MDVDAPPPPIPSSPSPKTPKKKEVARLAADASHSHSLPPNLVRTLVLSYLLRNCHRRTALAFVEAAAPIPTDDAMSDLPDPSPSPSPSPIPSLSQSQLDQLDKRRLMMDQVLSGDIMSGIAVAENLLCASMLQLFPMVHLRLLCQHFVELVRARKTIDALAFAQKEIAPLGKRNPEGLPLLQSYLPLLAYPNPELSPVFELMDMKHRESLAEELNDCVFGFLEGGEGRESELERLVRQLSSVMRRLGEREWSLAGIVADQGEEENG